MDSIKKTEEANANLKKEESGTVTSSKNAERIKKHRARLTEDEKIIRKTEDAERKQCERKGETLDERNKRLKKKAEWEKLKWNQLKELPSPWYLGAMNDQQFRFEEIVLRHPEWKDFVQFGFFCEPIDNLWNMDLENYKKIWQFAIKDDAYYDAFLHLKRAIEIHEIGIVKEMKNKFTDWNLNDFKIWANKFIEAQGMKSLPIISLKDIWGLDGFYEVNIQIKALKKTNFLRVDLIEFLVSDGECKAVLIIPPEMGIEIGQEYIIKKCDFFWNYDDGCPFLHLYAPIYIEKAAASKIEIVEIDDLHYPKWEIEPEEMYNKTNLEMAEMDSNIMDD